LVDLLPVEEGCYRGGLGALAACVGLSSFSGLETLWQAETVGSGEHMARRDEDTTAEGVVGKQDHDS
jgi:hypothetical protein